MGSESTEDRLSGAAQLLEMTHQCEDLKARLQAYQDEAVQVQQYFDFSIETIKISSSSSSWEKMRMHREIIQLDIAYHGMTTNHP